MNAHIRIKDKLASQRGETLIEALAGILIAVLAGIILLTSVGTATHMNANASMRDAQLKAEQLFAATYGKTAADNPDVPSSTAQNVGSAVVTFESNAGDASTFDVTTYGGEDFVSYKQEPEEGD